MALTPVFDRVLQWLKWPVAAWTVLSVPQLVVADIRLLQQSATTTAFPFWLGLLVYVVLWRLMLRRRFAGSWLPTLTHELTHGLFALLTGHRIVALRATWAQGGELRFAGGPGNWLISIAPYVFPLALVVAVPLLSLFSVDNGLRLGLLGLICGFEAVSMWRQVHRQQSDLQRVGWPFVALFVPGALLWTYGAGLVLVHKGTAAALAFGWVQAETHAGWLKSLLGALVGG